MLKNIFDFIMDKLGIYRELNAEEEQELIHKIYQKIKES